MKKIKLLTPILGLVALSATAIPLASCAKSTTNNVELDQSVIDKGIKVKSSNLVKGKDSYIELELPNDEVIEEIVIQIGGLVCSKNTDHLRVEGGRIWIDAYYMVANKVTIKYVKFVKKLTGMVANCEKTEWEAKETIKDSDLTVKLTYNDGSYDPLVWDTDYTISKGGKEIESFSTRGYTFTKEDAQEGKVTFQLKYKKVESVIYALTVNVKAAPVTQEEFLEKYSKFIENYKKVTTQYETMNFDLDGAKYQGVTVTKANISYIDNVAIAWFGLQGSEVGGAAVSDIRDLLDSYDDDLHNKEFTISEKTITYKVTLKSDTNQYEFVSYDENTFMTNWVNTFADSTTYTNSDTKLTNINYVEKSKFDIDTTTGYVKLKSEFTSYTGAIKIPEKIGETTVKGIEANGFGSAQAQSITFEKPENIEYIGKNAFFNCSLTSFEIPSGIKKLEIGTFQASKIQNITIPKNVEVIESMCFSLCLNLESVTIEGCNDNTSKLWKINNSAFQYCSNTKFTSLVLPESLGIIYTAVFAGCNSLTSVEFKNTTGWMTNDKNNTPITLNTPEDNATRLKNGDLGQGMSIFQTQLIEWSNASSKYATSPGSFQKDTKYRFKIDVVQAMTNVNKLKITAGTPPTTDVFDLNCAFLNNTSLQFQKIGNNEIKWDSTGQEKGNEFELFATCTQDLSMAWAEADNLG